MTSLKPASQDLVAGHPMWLALSDMFLDTDVSLSREGRMRELAVSPYALVELEAVLVGKVYPVCRANLLSVAGEWAGLDLAWLEANFAPLGFAMETGAPIPSG